jgi:CelD/BcsL family acetyltransferase involved in cellulose biosynthesis
MNAITTQPRTDSRSADPTVSVLSELSRVEALACSWSELLERSATNEPMLTPAWLLTWWQVFGQGSGREVQVALFHDGDELVGLAPLCKRRYWYRPGIPFRRLEPLGADVDEGDGVCSDYLGVIAVRGAEARVARALARALVARVFGSWDELLLPMMDGNGALPGLLARAFNQAGLVTACTPTTVAPYLPLPATWEAYLQLLSKKKRYGIVRAQRDFDDWAGGTSELRCVTTPAELEDGKRILATLHNERWDAAGRQGVFTAPRFAAFHDAVLPRLLDQGALELMWLNVRGEPVAAIYNLVWNGKVYFYQCGRKLDVPRGQRLGIVMLAYAIRRAIEAGRREFDALAGESLYKSQLMLAARPLVQVRAARPSLLEQTRKLAGCGIACARVVRHTFKATGRWLGPLRRRAGQAETPAKPAS